MPRAERRPPRRRPPCTRIDLRMISVGLLLATRHARSRASRGSLAAGSRGYITVARIPALRAGPLLPVRAAASYAGIIEPTRRASAASRVGLLVHELICA